MACPLTDIAIAIEPVVPPGGASECANLYFKLRKRLKERTNDAMANDPCEQSREVVLLLGVTCELCILYD